MEKYGGEMSIDYVKIAENLDKVCAERDLSGFYSMISPWMKDIEILGKSLHGKEIHLRKSNLSLEEMQSLALEFYDDLGHGFPEKISNVIMDKTTVFHTTEPTDEGGKMAVGVHGVHKERDDSDFIEIDLHPKNDINGSLTVAHEFGHILSQRVQEKRKPKTDCLGEIETMFIEQIFIDWLFENGKITEEDRTALRQERTNNLDAEIHQLLDEKTIIDKLGTPISAQKLQELDERLTENGLIREKEHYQRQIEAMISNPDSTGEYKFRYVFGEIVARAMYQDYQTEPDETLERLNKFLEHSAEYDFGMRKTWQSGKCRSADQIDQEQLKLCLTDLLGEEYEQKISKVINPDAQRTALRKPNKNALPLL